MHFPTSQLLLKYSKHSDCLSIAATQSGHSPFLVFACPRGIWPLVRSIRGSRAFWLYGPKRTLQFRRPSHSLARSLARPPERKIAPRQDPSRARPSSDHSDIIPPRGKTTRQRPLPSFLQTCIQDWYLCASDASSYPAPHYLDYL